LFDPALERVRERVFTVDQRMAALKRCL
jgi:hypothetical protein